MEQNVRKQLLVGALAAFSALTSQAAGFVNGGFEDNNFGSWQTGGGCRANVLNSALAPTDFLPAGSRYNTTSACSGTGSGGVTGHSSVIGTGYVDPHVGALLGSTVYSGSYAARVEDTTTGGYASVLSQTVLNYTDSDIFFTWKAVLLGAHGINDAATFVISLRDLTTGTEIIRREYNAATNPGSPFSNSGGIYYTANWQIEQLTIGSGLQGHDFQLTVLAADCEPTGHYGYVYLDGFGAVNPPPGGNVPEPGTLALAGLALAGVAGARRRRKQA